MRYVERDLSCGHVLGAWQDEESIARAQVAQSHGHRLTLECPTCAKPRDVTAIRPSDVMQEGLGL